MKIPKRNYISYSCVQILVAIFQQDRGMVVIMSVLISVLAVSVPRKPQLVFVLLQNKELSDAPAGISPA
ncbi:hypothetical protein [Pedobacter antarcticus]|uniref:hypothetical protein n=1 Tax=Pedobacter antarcticus TaxID=34086 RepID=UPI00292EF833|nr:hypothetical protein [Pedobacter antarcticus]